MVFQQERTTDILTEQYMGNIKRKRFRDATVIEIALLQSRSS